MKKNNVLLSLLLAAVMAFACAGNALAVTNAQVKAAVQDVAGYVLQTVPSPAVGSIGGEWAVLGLARSGYTVPQSYYDGYYANVEKYVAECKGVLHQRKYTEYSRVILGVTAIGRDARTVAGYDLTLALGDYEKTIWQGLSGPIWALMALDTADYPVADNAAAKTQATRQMYVDRILELQLADGGWNLAGGEGAKADTDMTAMALQALAKYKAQPAVAAAIERGVAALSAIQNEDGTFSTMGTATSESCAQVVVALAELGISQDDSRFVKNGKSALDGLLSFYTKGNGFEHIKGSGTNGMATEQGFYALVAVDRAASGKTTLYDMSDVAPTTKTFPDVVGHANQAAIEALAASGVINGMEDGNFAPNNGMTRAEFATIVVRALGLEPKANKVFSDVAATAWYAGFIGTASEQGIINGVGGGKFDPNAGITRQEAATMVARAAALCGIDTEIDEAAAAELLSRFADNAKVESWAVQGLAVCYQSGILSKDGDIAPTVAAKRCEIAQMVYNLLEKADKIA